MNSLIDGKYRILRAIGNGCIGSVFEVEHERIGKHFALKLLHDDLQERQDQCQRFLARAKQAAGVQHANIARIEDVGVVNEKPYMVTELCRGRSLRAHLRAGRLKVDEACEIGLHLLAALAAAHEQKIWHRDLKPENIMVELDGDGRAHVKVLDFGMTQGVFEDDAANSAARWARSSPRYLAPEVLTGGSGDAQSDLYSVASLMYEMLSGRPLVPETDELSAIKVIVASQWRPLAQANPGLPEPLVRAIEATLDADPLSRLGSPQALARHLLPYVAPRLKRRDAFAAPTLDPVLRFSRRVVDRLEPTTASLRLNMAPKPRVDPAMPQRLLVAPTFPRNAHAPRFESLNADAFGKRRKPTNGDSARESPPAGPRLRGTGKTAAVAIGAGIGVGAALAWLNAVI